MIEPVVYANQTAEELFGRREETTDSVEEKVREIIADVRKNGDAALRKYSALFDGYRGTAFEVTEEEFSEAFAALKPSYISVLKGAAANIEKFHSKQIRYGFETETDGKIIGQKVTPISRVGIYVPGGTAAYPSTVLMNAIPAKIAGVREIIMATPVKSDGKVRAEVLAAARICGVDRVFKLGGAQAIAALAYGTESVPKVDKITGPGRDFVAAAKKLVSGVACGIDMLAGPSEILVIADEGADPEFVAADLLSQAEHDILATAILVTDSENLARNVSRKLEERVGKLSRESIARASLEKNCKIILTRDLETAVRLSDEYAPEHLELCVEKPFGLLEKVGNAGSVFLGYFTPEATGDYYAGSNHTLPTSGTAKFSSPLSVDDFVKTTQYVYYRKEALEREAEAIEEFAESEGLTAHAESVKARIRR